MAKLTLTEEIIESLEPDGTRYDVMDDGCRNLGVRVNNAGKKSFIYFARLPGSSNPTRSTIGEYPGMSLTDARKKANMWREMIRKGIDPRTEKEVHVDRRLWAVRTQESSESIGVWYCEENELFDLVDQQANPYDYEYKEIVPERSEGMIFNFFGKSRDTTMGVVRNDRANHEYHLKNDVTIDWVGDEDTMFDRLFFERDDDWIEFVET